MVSVPVAVLAEVEPSQSLVEHTFGGGDVAYLLQHLSLESAAQAHLFALRRFEADHELVEKLQQDFYSRPAGWLAEIEQGQRLGWVGRLADTYVGFVDLAPEADEGLAYLSIYVTPDYRQLGVASSMVRMVAPRLKELGLQGLLAQTEADNWPARRCLRRAGFRTLTDEEKPLMDYAVDLSRAASAD